MRRIWFLAAAISLNLAVPGFAFIERLYTLAEVMQASHVIVGCEFTKVDARAKTAIAVPRRTLKGECVFGQFKMNFGVGQAYFPDVLIKRAKVGAPVLLFYQQDNTARKLVCLGHTDGFWFQLFGDLREDPDASWWALTHVEIKMNRTFDGTTLDLVTLTADVQAGRREPPQANPKLPALTREQLLGAATARGDAGGREGPEPVAAVTAPARPALTDGADGYEASPNWSVEAWGNPAAAHVEDAAPGRGKVLRLSFQPGGEAKVAATVPVGEEIAMSARLVLESFHQGTKPIRLALAIRTGPDEQYYESLPVPVPAGRWKQDVQFDLTAATFKSASTDWEHRTRVEHLDQARRLTVLVYEPSAGETLTLDRVRPDEGGLFSRTLPLSHAGGEARSVSWADYDGDGDWDVLLCSTNGNRLYRNDGGEFKDVTQTAGLSGGSRCASWADYDQDGDPDLLVSTPGLWVNDGGTFRDASRRLPLPGPLDSEGSGWIDADGNGLPDILLTTGGRGVFLLLNRGSGPDWFVDASASHGLGEKGIGLGNGDYLSIADFDGDGFTDFLYNLGSGLLARNEDGKTFHAARQSRVAYTVTNEHKIGTAFSDYDGDGDVDLFVPQRGRSMLFRNNNDFTFTDVIDLAGDLATLGGNARSAAWGDLDGDGDPDLVVGFSDAPIQLFLNEGNGHFTRVAEKPGVADLSWTQAATGLAFADVDEDGDVDLLVTGETRQSGILINAARPGPKVPLRLRLPASECPGALVRVHDPHENLLAIESVGLVQNFSSQGPPEAVFRVRPGTCLVSILRTNGTLVRTTVEVTDRGYSWVMKPGDLKPDARP